MEFHDQFRRGKGSLWSMRIVVMSDTHLERVNDAFADICTRYCKGADMVIHLGDWSKGPVLDFLQQYPLEAVSGNSDDPVLWDRLPMKKVIRVMDFRIGITHGWGSVHDIRRKLSNEFERVDAVLFGHTHQPIISREKGILWFNPGSVFHGRNGAGCSLGILHVKGELRGEIIPL